MIAVDANCAATCKKTVVRTCLLDDDVVWKIP